MAKRQPKIEWHPGDIFVVKRKNHHQFGLTGTVIRVIPEFSKVSCNIGGKRQFIHTSSIRRPLFGLTDIDPIHWD